MRNWDWMDHGACREVDPEWFFTTVNRGTSTEQSTRKHVARNRAMAREACNRCWVKEECFWDAMVRPDPHSLRAGLSPRQLDLLRRAHKKEIEAREALLSRVA